MKLIEVHDRYAWDAFVAAQPLAQFTQSWAWGQLQASRGKTVRRFAFAERGHWVAVVQMEYRAKRFGQGYWFAPRGPVFAATLPVEARQDAMLALCEELLSVPDLRRNCLFWRMEPVSELERPEGLVPLSFRRNDASNPASTYVIELAKTEEELLKAMHEKTRYNIRVADKRGVTVRTSTSSEDFEAFSSLMDETARRDGFVQHPASYLRATFETLSKVGMARIRLAELGGRALAANLEVAFGDTMTYLYGASSSEDRQAMAPYAIHWAAIRVAKAAGHRFYDMWGANPQSKAMYYYKPTWEGITRFKKGWGGRLVNFVGTWDLPFNAFLYRLAFLNKFLRG